ncbi:MAG: DUF169 domain-containing protein [Eubacterium sp.]
MPFKTEKIQYGLPHKEYPKENVIASMNQLTDILHLEKEPVAVTLLHTKEDYDQYPAENDGVKIAYCVMVKQAAMNGIARKTLLENHACDGATTALGLEPSTEEIESGKTYFSYNLYSSVSTAHRHRSQIKSLHREQFRVHGVAVVPLSKCEKTPDVIITISNAWQAMRMVQGYEYFSGRKPKIDLGAMQAMCSELTASPYITGEMNVSVMCPSTRFLCKWDETDLGVSIPYELFGQVCRGVACSVMEY